MFKILIYVVEDELDSLESSSPPQPIANNIIEITIIEMINFMDLTIYPPITCFKIKVKIY